MKSEIVELKELSGSAAKIYSVVLEGKDGTLFDDFLQQYTKVHPSEVRDIVDSLRAIGKTTGAREQYFKINEGRPGDGVCALYDRPSKKLRLYCIRFGCVAVVLGGGGPKKVRTYQEDPVLSRQVEIMKSVSQSEKDIKLTDNGELVGKMVFNEEENEDDE